jgi:catechol 2,3-dioxygenase-like lactoylglutathione lyase family enzyme
MRRFGLLALAVALPLAGVAPAAAQSASPPAQQAVSQGGLMGPVLFVSDVARSVRFYEAIGMKVAMRMGPPDRLETILAFGGDPRGVGIILLSDSTATPVTIEHGHGYDRTVMRMGSLSAASGRLQAAGFAAGPIRDVAMGYKMMLATDPDGYKLELVEGPSQKAPQ